MNQSKNYETTRRRPYRGGRSNFNYGVKREYETEDIGKKNENFKFKPKQVWTGGAFKQNKHEKQEFSRKLLEGDKSSNGSNRLKRFRLRQYKPRRIGFEQGLHENRQN